MILSDTSRTFGCVCLQADGITLEEYLKGVPAHMQELLLDSFGGRHVLLNNRWQLEEERKLQAQAVLHEVERVVQDTNGVSYQMAEMEAVYAANNRPLTGKKARRQRQQEMHMKLRANRTAALENSLGMTVFNWFASWVAPAPVHPSGKPT